jgi:hypothetical protein
VHRDDGEPIRIDLNPANYDLTDPPIAHRPAFRARVGNTGRTPVRGSVAAVHSTVFDARSSIPPTLPTAATWR